MKAEYSYVETEPSDLSAALRGALSLEGLSSLYTDAVSSNVLIPVCSKESLESSQRLLDALTSVSPSRYFLVLIDNDEKEVRTEIAAHCRFDSDSESGCAALIRITCPESKFSAVPSILRANFFTGVEQQLFLLDNKVPANIVRELFSLSESVVVDSSQFEVNKELLGEIVVRFNQVVDLQWVALSSWRDAIRNMFAMPQVGDLLRGLESVTVVAGSSHSFASRLIAGWVVSKLSVELPKNCIFINSSTGKPVEVVFKADSKSANMSIVEITFDFGGNKKAKIGLKGQSMLETQIELEEVTRTCAPYRDSTQSEALRRYFTIGDSNANYAAALKVALELQQNS